MTYMLEMQGAYDRTAKKFLKKRPHLNEIYQQCIADIAEDPFQQKLGTHLLKGKYKGSYAIVLTGSYRIIVLIDKENRQVLFLDIGNHEDVYK